MTFAELQQQIEQLSPEERAQLRDWLLEPQDDDWDRQIESDVAAGRLDALIQEARDEIAANRTSPL